MPAVLLASTGSLDLARLLLDLLIVLVAATAAAELAERLRVPAVLGEIVAGLLIGPSALGLIDLDGARGVSLGMLAEIGVLLLLFQVGTEMDLVELRKVGRVSLTVAVIGVAAPFAGGLAIALLFVESTTTAVFVGAALTATSVGITARVLGDLRALATTEARVVLGAAVADDVLGLVILTVVVKVVTGGTVDATTIVSTLGLALAFLAVTGTIGVFGVPRALESVHRRASSPSTVTATAAALLLAFAMLAHEARLAFIIGAFMAGLGVGRSRHHERVARDLGAVARLTVPVFFALIGVNTDLGAFGSAQVVVFAVALTVVAVAGKLVAAIGAPRATTDRLVIGLGMIPRGEVGLIFASIGLSTGVLDPDQYGTLVLVVLATTVATPPLLRARIGRDPVVENHSATTSAGVPTADEDTVRGVSVTVDHGSIRWVVEPESHEAVAAALAVAAATAHGRPDDSVMSWFADRRSEPVEWRHSDTPALARLLRSDNPRAWRFLEASAVLERALPEVAGALDRRRADLSDLDPVGALRCPVVDGLETSADQFGPPSDDLVVAAFALDVSADGTGQGHDHEGRSDEADTLLSRLVGRAEAARLLELIDDARVLRQRVTRHGSGATRSPAIGASADSLTERDLLQIAAHLRSERHLHDTYRLALALAPLSGWQAEALRLHVEVLGGLLRRPEALDRGAVNLALARRTEAEHILATDSRDTSMAIERLRFAADGYLLTHPPAVLARHALLVEPVPRPGRVRVDVSPHDGPALWVIDVVCRDRPGLLATIAACLDSLALDVVTADVTSWPDGAVLDSFVVRSVTKPDGSVVAAAFERALTRRAVRRRRASHLHDVDVDVDGRILPWHTRVTVHGPDRDGLLAAVTAVFADLDIVVHSAHIESADGHAVDRFDVSDRLGRKLGPLAVERLRARTRPSTN